MRHLVDFEHVSIAGLHKVIEGPGLDVAIGAAGYLRYTYVLSAGKVLALYYRSAA